MPVKMLAWFFGLVAVCGVLGAMLSNNSSTPPPAAPAVAPTPAQKSFTMQGDQAAKLIGKCGKPYKDFTKVEGGQPIRHVVYKKQNVELMYSREGVPAWVLVGIFRANADENIDKDEANRRLPCAAGSIRTVLD